MSLLASEKTKQLFERHLAPDISYIGFFYACISYIESFNLWWGITGISNPKTHVACWCVAENMASEIAYSAKDVCATMVKKLSSLFSIFHISPKY